MHTLEKWIKKKNAHKKGIVKSIEAATYTPHIYCALYAHLNYEQHPMKWIENFSSYDFALYSHSIGAFRQ